VPTVQQLAYNNYYYIFVSIYLMYTVVIFVLASALLSCISAYGTNGSMQRSIMGVKLNSIEGFQISKPLQSLKAMNTALFATVASSSPKRSPIKRILDAIINFFKNFSDNFKKFFDRITAKNTTMDDVSNASSNAATAASDAVSTASSYVSDAVTDAVDGVSDAVTPKNSKK
jgi:hypothetical protein